MTQLWLLIAILQPPAAPSPAILQVIETWQTTENRNISGDVTWHITRDSLAFISRVPEERDQPWRLRYHGDNFRLDGWQPVMGHDDPRPDRAATSVSRSRLEFLTYLKSGFAGPARIPSTKPYTIILTPTSDWPDGWGDLEHLLAAAPAIATRPFSNPLAPINPDKLNVSDEIDGSLFGEKKLLVVRETLDGGKHRLLWLSVENSYRPYRVLDISGSEILRQIDFQYLTSMDHMPSQWTVQAYNPRSRHLDFMEGTRLALAPRPELTPEVFSPSADSYRAFLQPKPKDLQFFRYHFSVALLSWPALIATFLAFTTWRAAGTFSRKRGALTDHSGASGKSTAVGFWHELKQCRLFMMPHRLFSLRDCLAMTVVIGCFLALRSSPLLDLPLNHTIVDVENAWTKAKEVCRSNATEAEWKSFVQATMTKLQPIATSLEATHNRAPGAWDLLASPDESAESIRHDLIQLTRNEIPAALNTSPRGSAIHDERLRPWLDRLRAYAESQGSQPIAED